MKHIITFILLLIACLFCHCIEDFKIQQGWTSQAKCKKYWIENAPDDMYKNDYKVVLLVHSFVWTCFIHIPIAIYVYLFNVNIIYELCILMFIADIVIHYLVDNLKANLYKINLVVDQSLHVIQIICTILIEVICFVKV